MDPFWAGVLYTLGGMGAIFGVALMIFLAGLVIVIWHGR